MADIVPGNTVRTRYKTGEYVARFVEERNDKVGIVEILAVLRHPTQGDLHQPNEVNVPLFHQRKALAHHEKAVVQLASLVPFDGQVPDYRASLREALDLEKEKLRGRDDTWSEKALNNLNDLESDYFPTN
ncbi:sporulation phosphorelay system protein KapB [Tuberibacillus sp. Marseille-P3662]|uniref:sporulation phosphorelay system protein KapB n=1 Tax=Tuberibacillus sp. Marseille-P3662 TaxID=1965358 RepID=UPI000A1CE05F|nr:sporulation phosphorelay system protein KapB [Tuberibacillus sp. Marseille-P3662]